MTSSRDPLGHQRGQADNDAVAQPDGGPELRWRRTLDLRKRPARLKVDGLIKEFGYADLSPDAANAIEARLARVGLQVEPSLHIAEGGDVITIGRLVRARLRSPAAGAGESRFTGTRSLPVSAVAVTSGNGTADG